MVWRIPSRARFFASIGLLGWAAASVAQDTVLCRAGNGTFSGEFAGGRDKVSVHVGATKVAGLSTRSCEATITWKDQQIAIESGVWLLDLDTLGADLGMDSPVATFQVKRSESECCATYLIYSLQSPPRLMRTLTGGSSFRASDTDLDSRVEIWTDDARVADGLDGISVSELDFAPPIVLRFEHGRLFDASSEFQLYYDGLIAKQKGRLDTGDLKEFKSSNGKLDVGSMASAERGYRLRKAKIGILEIVWAYLYSGREREAWSTLADLWPVGDVDRIRRAIAQVRERGVHSQVQADTPPSRHKKHATIYDVTMTEGDESEVASPRPIQVWRPAPDPGQILPPGERVLTLVIDSAGKVRSVTLGNSAQSDADLLNATMAWKFTPALRGGHAVASRTHLAVSLRK